jgi:hypothetical protein
MSQASRVSDMGLRRTIQQTQHVREVKKLVGGNQRDNWKDFCVSIAEKLLRDKFTRNKELRKRLMDTKRKSILYHNAFGDFFWGLSETENKGTNHLGMLMERVREDIRSGAFIDNWISDWFSTPHAEAIDITVNESKGEETFSTKQFEKKSILFIGKDSESCDITAEHPTVSRQNSVFILDKKLGPVIVDLGSANGTHVNGVAVSKPFVPVPLTSAAAVAGDTEVSWVSVGASKRRYYFIVDLEAGEKRKVALYHKIANPLTDANADGADTDPSKDYETTVFVRNIPAEASERDVRAFFDSCGAITHLSIPLDKYANRSGAGSNSQQPQQQPPHRGIAFVTFVNMTALLQAVSKDGDNLLGTAVRVKRNLPPSSRDGKDRPKGTENRHGGGDRARDRQSDKYGGNDRKDSDRDRARTEPNDRYDRRDDRYSGGSGAYGRERSRSRDRDHGRKSRDQRDYH